MTIAFDVTLAVVALIASVYVGLEARNALVDEVNWYIPGQWDVYHKGELVKSDCTMDEATDYVLSDGNAAGQCTEGDEWRLTYHGELASDGFVLTNEKEYSKGRNSTRRGVERAFRKGYINSQERKRILNELYDREYLGGAK